MFKQIMAIARKEVRLWAQQPGQWIVLFLVPLVFIYIFGAAFSGSDTPTVAVYAVNEDNGDWGTLAMNALRDASNLDVEILETRPEADELVGKGDRMAALVIPAGFSEAVLTDDGAAVQVIVDPARDDQAKIVVGLANAALVRLIVDAEVSRSVSQGIGDMAMDLGSDSGTSGGMDQGMLRDFMQAGMKGVVASQVKDAMDDPLVTVELQTVSGDTGDKIPSPMQAYVPGYSLMFVFFLVSNLAVTVVRERETGTLRRLLITPPTRGRILMGKLLPIFVLALLQLVVMFTVSAIVFDLEPGDTPLALGLVMLGTAAAVAGMGIMIAALAKNEGQAGGLTTLLILAMAAVSGCLSPAIVMPGLNYLAPHYWALQGFNNVMVRGLGYSGALLPTGILFGFAIVFFIIGVLRFKFE